MKNMMIVRFFQAIKNISFIVVAFLLTKVSFAQEPYTYTSDVAHFSITFPGEPHVMKTEGTTDIQYEDNDSDITYIVGYKKSESTLTGVPFCEQFKKDMEANSEINISSIKITELDGIPAIRSVTTEEHRYQLFSYVRYDLILKGYEITIMLMSKEESLMLKDIKKFAASFKNDDI